MILVLHFFAFVAQIDSSKIALNKDTIEIKNLGKKDSCDIADVLRHFFHKHNFLQIRSVETKIKSIKFLFFLQLVIAYKQVLLQ